MNTFLSKFALSKKEPLSNFDFVYSESLAINVPSGVNQTFQNDLATKTSTFINGESDDFEVESLFTKTLTEINGESEDTSSFLLSKTQTDVKDEGSDYDSNQYFNEIVLRTKTAVVGESDD